MTSQAIADCRRLRDGLILAGTMPPDLLEQPEVQQFQELLGRLIAGTAVAIHQGIDTATMREAAIAGGAALLEAIRELEGR